MGDLASDLRLLNEAGRAMHTERELGPLLDRILSLVDEVFHVDTCAVLLREADGDLRIARARGYAEEVVRTFRGALGQGITGWVMEHGEPLYVPDVWSDPRYIGGVPGAVAEVATPLKLDGEIIGVLDAEVRRRDVFDAVHLELFSAFAAHAATAIHNARLLESLDSKVKRLGLLNQCSRALSLTLDLDSLLAEVLRLSHEALRFERCAVLLSSKDAQHLTVRAAHGYKPEVVDKLVLKVGEGVTGMVAKTGQPRLVADVTKEPDYVEGVRGGRCEMAVPLVARGRVIGVLDAESTRPGAFAEPELELLTTFALSAAAAIHNAELYSELDRANATLRHNLVEITRMNRELSDFSSQISSANRDLESRVRELLTLQEASRTITSSLDLDETLQAIVRMAREIVSSSTSAIKLLDEESQEFRVRAVDRTDGADNAADLRSIVSAPLRIGDRTIGIFEIGSLTDDAFSEGDRRMLETLASQAAIAIENARLFESTQQTYFETIRSLAYALEARDAYTRGHSERVTAWSLKVAEALGLGEEDRQILGHAGMLHDIGKIGVADAILNKPYVLSEDDRKIIENHPLFGGTILAPLRFLERVQALVRHHHERFDGTGYPEGLKGETIPFGARIIAVCDAYDAMTSDRPYRKALSHEAAVGEVRAKSGTQFDPQIVTVFLEIVEQGRPVRGATARG